MNFAIYHGGYFHSYVNVYQRVDLGIFQTNLTGPFSKWCPRYYEARLSVRNLTLASRATRMLEEAVPWSYWKVKWLLFDSLMN